MVLPSLLRQQEELGSLQGVRQSRRVEFRGLPGFESFPRRAFHRRGKEQIQMEFALFLIDQTMLH